MKDIYVNSVRLRATFFALITVLFFSAIAIALIFQSSYLVLVEFQTLSYRSVLLCLVVIPLVFMFIAVLIDDIVTLIFDSMDNPPFLKCRSHLSTIFFNSESSILRALRFNNFFILIFFESFPLIGVLVNITASDSQRIEAFIVGYLIGGILFVVTLSTAFVFSHSINSLSQASQDKFYDLLEALNLYESVNGYLSSSSGEIGSFKTSQYHKRVVAPKKKLAKFFALSSILPIIYCITLSAYGSLTLLQMILAASFSTLFVSFAVHFFMPKFLGGPYACLLTIFILTNFSLALLHEKKVDLLNIKVSPVLKSSGDNFAGSFTEGAQYPICDLRWQNNSLSSSGKHLGLLDILPITGFIYSSDKTQPDDREWIVSLIKANFEGTELADVKIEHLDDQQKFGRSVVVYFPSHKIRLMTIRGTITSEEFLYDLNLYSLPQSLKIFDKLTPVIGFLPDKALRTIVKYLNVDKILGIKDKTDAILSTAKIFKQKSVENGDEFIVSGHSLGGIFAAITATKLDISGIAISPAGIGSLLHRYNIYEETKVLKSLTTVLMQNDFLSKVGTHLGSVNTLACPYSENLCHNPATMICEIYLNCGDKRGRMPLYDCDEAGIKNLINESYN